MSQEMRKKLRGWSFRARISLILTCTALISLFVYHGWKSPADVDAAAIGPNAPTTASGTNWTSATNVYTQNATYASYNNTAQNNLIIRGFSFTTIPTGATIDGVTVTVWGYGSGNTPTQRTIRANLTTNGTSATGTAKTLALGSTNAANTLGGATDVWGASLTPALINSTNFGVIIADNDTTATALYIDYVSVTVNYTYDSTAPTIGTVTVSPTSSSYTTSSPTITASVTEPDSTVTGCEYTTNGSTWAAGAVSGASPNWTCTGSPTGLSGALTINIRATSSGGIGTGSAVSRTVDSTGPTDTGTLT